MKKISLFVFLITQIVFADSIIHENWCEKEFNGRPNYTLFEFEKTIDEVDTNPTTYQTDCYTEQFIVQNIDLSSMARDLVGAILNGQKSNKQVVLRMKWGGEEKDKFFMSKLALIDNLKQQFDLPLVVVVWVKDKIYLDETGKFVNK